MVAWHWQADGKHMSIGGQTRLWRSRAWLAFLAVLATPALASPVNVLECKSVSFSGPVPAVDVSSDFTVRRHVMATPPVEWLETDFWTQGKFEDNGYFEVTVYPHEGEPFTERSGSTRTLVQDGFGDLGDVIVDEAPTMNSTHSIEGWTLESVVIVLRMFPRRPLPDGVRPDLEGSRRRVSMPGLGWWRHTLYPRNPY
jgi:hypothetical protein